MAAKYGAVSNVGSLAQRSRKRVALLRQEIQVALEESRLSMLNTARTLSSGPYKTKVLRKMARRRKPPFGLYSKASPAPPMNPAVINLQKGKFKAGWRARRFYSGEAIGVRIYNQARQAQYMLGTEYMIERPVKDAIIRVERPKMVNALIRTGRVTLKQK